MNESLIVLPSARAIRQKQLHIDGATRFLPNYITMSDFIVKLCVVEGFKALDSDSRSLLLLEASDFKSFANLYIPRNFFTFTKNASYIFKFFQELSAEKYDIADLSTSDIYAEYEEHIAILQELYKRYEKLCAEKRALDPVFLPKLYSFNKAYVKRFKKIEIYIEGYLTNFEFELLLRCCEYSRVEILFSAGKFNNKMQKKLLDAGIKTEAGFKYTIALNTKEVIEKEKLFQNKNITCRSFSEPLLQVAFVKKKVYDFIKKGYKPEDIAVIVPDEKFAKVLQGFDTKSNFNFAMGEPFSYRRIYRVLEATYSYIEQDSKENEARLKRLGDAFYTPLRNIYAKKSEDIDIVEFLKNYKESFTHKQERKIFEEELYAFSKLLPYMKDMKVKSLLKLFLQRLSKRSLDDVRGGKITVMGVLETRLVEFDAVVIVDFSDTYVPKKSDKDMFLNTHVRKRADLPTMRDREDLQKHYYEMLLNRSKEAAICFVQSSKSSPSRFLKQLGIQESGGSDEQRYAELLFQRVSHVQKAEQEIILKYSFKDKKLSATKLKIFLTCKRKYYYKYIKSIEAHEIQKDIPKEHEIGSDIHLALRRLYGKKKFYDDEEELKRDLRKELLSLDTGSEFEKYLLALQERRMDAFCSQEVKRFRQGWRVHVCEESFQSNFAGAIIVGQIDRIDKRADEIYVFDYKTGSYPLYNQNSVSEASDFQLEFYYLLAQRYGNVIGCAYYDLKESKVVQEPFLEEKLAVLESNIKELLRIEEINFAKCEELKHCTYCEYKILCGRG